MAITVSDLVAMYEAEFLANETKLASLAAADVSSMGRSISASGARDALMKRQDWLLAKLAALGSPVGAINEPFVQVSRVRP